MTGGQALDFRLCELCAERQGEGHGLARTPHDEECFICRGLMATIPSRAREAAKKAKRFEFGTFSVGVSLPEGPQEREDELRSVLKLKGSETVKMQAARIVSELVAKTLEKKVDKTRPDLALLVRFEGEVEASSRPLFLYGRYAKPAGLPQRTEACAKCSGRGCAACASIGFRRTPSVEGLIGEKVKRLTGGERTIFTWLGTEDRTSRVYPPGRPFVVEVKSPVKRRIPKNFRARSKRGEVSVSSCRIFRSKPTGLPRFKFRTRILGSAASSVGVGGLANLHATFKRATVRFDRPHDKPAIKMVYSASAASRGRRLVIEAELDGGLPVKRFVTGELVSPSVSEVLGTDVICKKFDILRVIETGRFSYA